MQTCDPMCASEQTQLDPNQNTTQKPNTSTKQQHYLNNPFVVCSGIPAEVLQLLQPDSNHTIYCMKQQAKAFGQIVQWSFKALHRVVRNVDLGCNEPIIYILRMFVRWRYHRFMGFAIRPSTYCIRGVVIRPRTYHIRWVETKPRR